MLVEVVTLVASMTRLAARADRRNELKAGLDRISKSLHTWADDLPVAASKSEPAHTPWTALMPQLHMTGAPESLGETLIEIAPKVLVLRPAAVMIGRAPSNR